MGLSLRYILKEPISECVSIRKQPPFAGLSAVLVQIPWFETPVIFDIRAKPRVIASLTGTKGAFLPWSRSFPAGSDK